MTKTTKITTSIMLIAVLSLMTTSLSYQPQEVFASVTGGDSTLPLPSFQIIADPSDPFSPIEGVIDEDPTEANLVFAFDEKQDVELPEDLVLDLAAPMVTNPIPEETIVSSTMVIFDPPSSSLTPVQGCVEFAGQDVLGIQFNDSTLDNSDSILGHPDVEYVDYDLRGIEPSQNDDQVYFVGPLICFTLKASTPGDTFRVITTSEHVSTLLWQIGTFDNSPNELSGAGGLIKDNSVPPVVLYDVDGVDPKYPKALGNGGSGLTTQVDISFESESCQDAMLIYSRAGIENDEIYLDDVLKGTVMSAEGVYDTSSTDLGPLSAGPHVLTIKYIIDSNNTPDDWHNNDALALTCWEDAIPPLEICEDDTMDLIAGQHIDSGDVTVVNDGTTLLITIQTQDDWQLSESHVQIGETLDDFPLTKKGNPKVGNFDYQREYNPLVTEDTYEFLLADLDLESGDTITFAVHTVVVQTDLDGEIIAEETAWKQGDRFVEKGNWAMYNTYDIQECDVIE
jgi:hypothetical protein